MLTSTILASISHRTSTTTTHSKDASIFHLSFQPHSSLPLAVLKKSNTAHNALAASVTHVFAAQVDRAAVHVYSRATGAQQTLVALREKATALTLAGDGALVVLGTEEGGVMIWETHTGRVVRTPPAHLGAVTAIRVDKDGSFAVSAGEDGAVLVWNLPALMAFGGGGYGDEWDEWRVAPVRSLRGHKDGVVDVVLGHARGARNIAVSAGKDGTLVVWDYHEGTQLRTVLLPQPPTTLTLDVCDRAVYCGFADGSVVAVDFLGMDGDVTGIKNAVWDTARQTSVVQVSAEAKWKPPNETEGPVLSMETSYDGAKLLTGHESGNIIVWDVPTRKYNSQLLATPMPGPVSNVMLLEVTGFAKSQAPKLRIEEVVKPRFGELDTNDGTVPDNYKVTARLVGDLPFNRTSATDLATEDRGFEIDRILNHAVFPSDLIAESIADIQALRRGGAVQAADQSGEKDYMALAVDSSTARETELAEENAELKKQVEALKRMQKESFLQLERLSGSKAKN